MSILSSKPVMVILQSLFIGTKQGVDEYGQIHYTDFIAAILETQENIDEDRLAEAFDILDCDDTGKISYHVSKNVRKHLVLYMRIFPKPFFNQYIEFAYFLWRKPQR